jgi:hypothetical protein
MPSDEKKQLFISKKNTGFPAYLDFDKMRSEGIAYLGELSGKIWTDHNVHDPGITIFETLCYALLDLGYRTNLPIDDLLSRNPVDKTPDDNFFTPAQILSNNPLTITDYRKLLVDIPEVKNAWLEATTDLTDLCASTNPVPTDPNKQSNQLSDKSANCQSFLNGLYRVFIETEKDPDTDFPNPDKARNYKREVIAAVKKSLMAHRNLCEDFEEIYLLCKLPVGLCASIELEPEADVETVYVAIIRSLQAFFSPSPEFYTLPELLEKGKDIADIYAGRPYSKQSHGFVDTAELERITLKKEIHLSDVYQVIFNIEGVKRVSKLELNNCNKNKCVPEEVPNSWKFKLPENHIPSLSMNCTGISFSRNGMNVEIDSDKFEALFDLNVSAGGKVLYEMPSTKLDSDIPRGNLHPALERYISIQNDFPAVYGIAEGGLPNDASDERKAWALQLKGYLLFFDQFLANYLSQLKHLRQLFALSGPAKDTDRHTYFINRLTTVPELEKLLRFNSNNDNLLGSEGAMLVRPIKKTAFEQVKINSKYAEDWLNYFEPYSFSTLNELEDALSLLRYELQNEGETTIHTWQAADDCWLFTITPATGDFILLGQKTMPTQNDALRLASTVEYTGVFEENYRSFLTQTDRYTFQVELTINDYTQYLSLLAENRDLYIKRRKSFLSHLSARFAERFTDLVLLNWKSGQEMQGIGNTERFLSQYDDISRNRGRAYDYITNNWNTDNSSGFEKKVKALAGIASLEKTDLCHFTVDLYDEQYIIQMDQAGAAAFRVAEKFDLKEEAEESVSEIISALSRKEAYRVDPLGKPGTYTIYLNYGGKAPAVYHRSYSNSNEAEQQADYLHRLFSKEPHKDAITEYSWIWTVHIKNEEGENVYTAKEKWEKEEAAKKGIQQISGNINNPKKWNTVGKGMQHELSPVPDMPDHFVDLSAFSIDINSSIIGKPGKYTYDALDKKSNTFKLCPAIEFDNTTDAHQHCCNMLLQAINETNYTVRINNETGKFRVFLGTNEEPDAFFVTEYSTKSAALKSINTITAILLKNSYRLELEKKPETWKFRFPVRIDEGQEIWLDSESAYPSPETAREAAVRFYQQTGNLVLNETKTATILASKTNKASPRVFVTADPKAKTAIKEALLREEQLVAASSPKPENSRRYIAVDGPGQFNTFVYRLVNKIRVPASLNRVFATRETAWEARKYLLGLTRSQASEIPMICYGGDIFEEVKNSATIIHYRYQLKLHSIKGFAFSELVLFESVEGYASKEDAQKAFEENYMHLLRHGAREQEYGNTISIVPLPLPEEIKPGQTGALVFVPAATRKLLEENNISWKQVAEYLDRYPVKMVEKGSADFAGIFCTEPEKKDTDACRKKEITWVYYFQLALLDGKAGSQNEPTYWYSTKYFEKPDEARAEFQYFSWLLQFAGNLYADCGCIATKVDGKWINNTGWKISIREVLAQSINWFTSEKAAWGKQGVEQFICAIQNGQSIHQYQNLKNCCYSFYVSCGSPMLEHPCLYDTATKRNQALELLFTGLSKWKKDPPFWYQKKEKQVLLLTGEQGEPYARMNPELVEQVQECALLAALAEKAKTGHPGFIEYHPESGLLVLTQENNGPQFYSIESRKGLKNDRDIKIWISEWIRLWKKWGCFFPITRTCNDNCESNHEQDKKYNYCIEIKLPGFNTCNEDDEIGKPCTCAENAPDKTSDCYIAWKSPCCFDECEKATRWLLEAIEVLRSKSNYYPVFDCTCNSYGIKLHTQKPTLYDTRELENEQKLTERNKVNRSHIIARNPQCYLTTNDVCVAVETAGRLVNSEGLHLAEHILLRPHCKEDCCDARITECTPDCTFPSFKSGMDDPCNDSPGEICFQPGIDPYSFIATVVLPAWSERFRNGDNRSKLENLLYREAPAHVLLRILWLKPADFCYFETTFKQWNRWLASKKDCTTFDPCQLIRLLFRTPYDCLDDCTDCLPCEDPETKAENPCVQNKSKPKNAKRCFQEPNRNEPTIISYAEQYPFLNQVNKYWCFERICIPRPQKGWRELNCEALKYEEERDKAKIINARMNRYRNIPERLMKLREGNELVEKVHFFLQNPDPDSVALDTIIQEIARNEKATKGKHLTKMQQQDLVQAAICYYLDKIYFNEKGESKSTALKQIATRVKKSGFDLQKVYTYWDAAEVEKYAPETDTDSVRLVLTGKK